MPILMVSERMEGNSRRRTRRRRETYRTAKGMLSAARNLELTNRQLIIDPGIAPIGSDVEGNLKRLMAAIRMIHDDPDFAGCHRSVGLSNFTVMLPSKRPDGMPVKGNPGERVFDTGDAAGFGHDHRIPDPAVRCWDLTIRRCGACKEVLSADGFDAIMRVREFCAWR